MTASCLLQLGLVSRVLIIDLDVHQVNGKSKEILNTSKLKYFFCSLSDPSLIKLLSYLVCYLYIIIEKLAFASFSHKEKLWMNLIKMLY